MVLGIVILLVLSSLHLPGEYLKTQWFLGSLGLGILFCRGLSRYVGILPRITLFYFIARIAWVTCYVDNQFSTYDELVRMQIYFCASHFGFLLGLIVPLMFLIPLGFRRQYQNNIGEAIGYFGVLNSMYVIAGWVWGVGILPNGIGYSGFLNYAGLNGALIACTVPYQRYLKDGHQLWAGVFTLAAICLSKSAIPFGVLWMVWLATWWAYSRFSIWKSARVALVTSPVLIAALWILNPGPLFTSAGRFPMYRVFLKHWWDNANHWVGFAPGAFIALAEKIQILTGFNVTPRADGTLLIFAYTNMHSDWGQMLFENGYIGVLLVACCVIESLMNLLVDKRIEFASLVGFVACAVFSAPTRNFPFAIVGAYAFLMGLAPVERQRILHHRASI